jgi:hypothetical protein
MEVHRPDRGNLSWCIRCIDRVSNRQLLHVKSDIRYRHARGYLTVRENQVAILFVNAHVHANFHDRVGILSKNVWLTSSVIIVRSSLVKFLNMCKAKWAVRECRTSVRCDYCTQTWPWAYHEFSLSVPIVWIMPATLALEIAESVLHYHKRNCFALSGNLFYSWSDIKVPCEMQLFYWALRLDACDIDNGGDESCL